MEKMLENCGGEKLPELLKLIDEEEQDGENVEQLRRDEGTEGAEEAEKETGEEAKGVID